MAMTATISLSESTCLINSTVNAIVTVQNTGTPPVQMLSISPNAVLTGTASSVSTSVGFGNVILDGHSFVNGASGTQTYSFSVVPFSPSTGPVGGGAGTFSIGCTCISADGSVFKPTAATLTVNPQFVAGNEV